MTAKDEFIATLHSQDAKIRYAVNENGHATHIIKRVDAGLYDVYSRLRDIHCSSLPIILDIVKHDSYIEVHEEYVRGRTLDQTLRENGPLDDAALLDVALDVCRALTAIHGVKPPIVHRDIKPENIMERDSGGYVLIDFDAARIYNEDAKTDTKCIVTVGYAAPEQYGLAQTDVRSDLFSLGVTLYELKTGETYHMGASCGGILSKVIARCTAFEPGKRFQNAEQLLRRLEALQPRKTGTITKYRISLAVLACITVFALTYCIYLRATLRDIQGGLDISSTVATSPSPLPDTQDALDGVRLSSGSFVGARLTTQQGLIIPFTDGQSVTAALRLEDIDGAFPDDGITFFACRIDEMSVGARAEITDDGVWTAYTAGAFYVSGVAKCAEQTSGLLEALVIVTSSPAAYSECECIYVESNTRPAFVGDQTLPANGEPLYVELRMKPAYDDRICGATTHKEMFQMMGWIELAPEGADCGVTEDGIFYTSTPGTYKVMMPIILDGQYYSWGAKLIVKSAQ